MGWATLQKQAARSGQWCFRSLVELVYPSLCLLCDQPLDVPFHDAMYCWGCRRRYLKALSASCYRCGARLPYRIAGRNKVPTVPRQFTVEGCPDCRQQRWSFSRTVALGTYHGRWRDHVYELKRKGRYAEAYQAGKMLAYPLMQSEWYADYDCLLPMPTHFWRRLNRGFNQAEEIAAGMASLCQWPVLRRAVACHRYAGKQGQLTRQQRLENVRNLFEVRNASHLQGRSIVLVDDVMTTGATMNQLARVCRQSGAKRLAVAVVARACSQV